MKSLFNVVLDDVKSAFLSSGYDLDNIDNYSILKISDRPDLSDLQSNLALIIAKKYQKSPRDIASEILAKLQDIDYFKDIKIDGPGFINIALTDEFIAGKTNELYQDNRFGVYKKNCPDKVVIDYGGPNIAKPLHVGHLRALIVGDAIKNLYKFIGDDVTSDIHLGDWGRPIGLLIAYIEELYPTLPYFTENYNNSSDHQEIKSLIDVDELAKLYPLASTQGKENDAFLEKARNYTLKLQNGHKGFRALWQYFVDISVVDIQKILDKLNIEFDLFNGESSVNDLVRMMIVDLKNQNIIEESEGALVIKFDEKDNLPPLIMEKTDGAMLYSSTDMATIKDRIDNLKADKILYVVDARQYLHFEQLFKAATKSGIINKNTILEHIKFGTVNGKDGKPFKTRDGGVMQLSELISMTINEVYKRLEDRNIDEDKKLKIATKVGIAAVKFADLSNDRTTNYIFDIEKFCNFQGKTGPYILYSLVRIKSIIKKIDNNIKENDLSDAVISYVLTKEERDLAIYLNQISLFIFQSYQKNLPHILCEFLFELAKRFNQFYMNNHILNCEDKNIQISRLKIAFITYKQMKLICNIIGIEEVDEM